MSNFKVSSKLAAASLLAIAAALAAPSAFADNHYRGADRGQVSHDHGPSRDSHRDRRDNRGHHNGNRQRSEEHTSELQSLMRISYAVFCLKKNKSHHK